MLILFYYLPLAISGQEFLSSFTIRGDKLYTIHEEYKPGYVRCKVYDLKNGSIVDIVKNVKVTELDFILEEFELVFIDIPDNSQDSQNRLWVRAKRSNFTSGRKNDTYVNWVGYIDINDMSLKTDPNFIKFPIHENLPENDCTINKISNKYGSAIYITGGLLYSKKENRSLDISSFFKYNFTSKKWVDMSYISNGERKSYLGYKSVVIDNRYLVMLGGVERYNRDELERLDNSTYYNSLYNLTVFDTFTNNWEIIDMKPDIMDTSIATLKFSQFLATVYNNKIYVIALSVSKDNSFSGVTSPYIGILDYNSRVWSWSPIHDEDGSIYNSSIQAKEIFVYNNQLITYYDSTYTKDVATPILVFDLSTNRMKSTLRSSYKSNIKGTDKVMPTYAVVFIVISCTVLLLALLYLLYRKYMKNPSYKYKKIKYKGPIQEVWSNPDIDDSNNIIMWDIKKGLSIKQDNPNSRYSNESYPRPGNQNTSNLIEFD